MHEMPSLGAGKRHVKDYSIVKTIHREVVALLDGLPPVLRPDQPDKSWDGIGRNLPIQRQQILTVGSSFLIALRREHAQVHTESRTAAVGLFRSIATRDGSDVESFDST
jgi:hypothetical protein